MLSSNLRGRIGRNLLVICIMAWALTAASQVTVYTDCDYQGRSQTLDIGKYKAEALLLSMRSISSVQVEDGYSVSLYMSDGFGGGLINCSGDVSCLSEYGYDNTTVSVIVGKAVTLYAGCSYTAESRTIGPGNWNQASLDKWFSGKKLASLEVPEGMMVTVYDKPDHSGYSYSIYESDDCLDDEGWLDETRSLIVELSDKEAGPDCYYAEDFSDMENPSGWYIGSAAEYDFYMDFGNYTMTLHEDNEKGWGDLWIPLPDTVTGFFDDVPEGILSFDLEFEEPGITGALGLLFNKLTKAESCAVEDCYELQFATAENQLTSRFFDQNACSDKPSVYNFKSEPVATQEVNHIALHKKDAGKAWEIWVNDNKVQSLAFTGHFPLFGMRIGPGMYSMDNISFCLPEEEVVQHTEPLKPRRIPVFHALIYSDSTEADDRGCDRKVEMEKMDRFFEGIASTLDFRYVHILNSASDFRSAKALADIRSLELNEEDIVAFYYNGHGVNVNKDEWPSLSFRDKTYHSTPILNVLENQARQARMLLFINSCCNGGYANEGSDMGDAGIRESDPEIFEQNLKKLFLGQQEKKTVRLCSSRDGQLSNSWTCTADGETKWVGSVFGVSFREVFQDYCYQYQQDPVWDSIIERSKVKTKINGNAGVPYGMIYERGENLHTDTLDMYPSAFMKIENVSSDKVVNSAGKVKYVRDYSLTNTGKYPIRVEISYKTGYYRGCSNNNNDFELVKQYSGKKKVQPNTTVILSISSDYLDAKDVQVNNVKKCFSVPNYYIYDLNWVRK